MRLLPAPVVVFFVLTLTLFSERGYVGVWCKVTSALDRRLLTIPTASALRQARTRLGPAPLHLLFDRLRGPVAPPGLPGTYWHRLRTVIWDGSTIDLADTGQVRAAFGTPQNQHGDGGYPQLLVAILAECGTRAIIDATFDRVHLGEPALMARMLSSLRPGMLLLADRNFAGVHLWAQAAATGAHLLWRVKSNLVLTPVIELDDGSYLARRSAGRGPRRGLPVVRVIECVITVRLADGSSRSEHYRLMTTLTDHRRYPARALAECYGQRWQVETLLFGFKAVQRGSRRALRSRTAEGVRQEMYAYLVTHHLLRHLIAHVALEQDVEGERVSFTAVLAAVRDSVVGRKGGV